MPIAHPPQGLIDAVAKEPELRPEWNLDFASALTRLLTAKLRRSPSPLSERTSDNLLTVRRAPITELYQAGSHRELRRNPGPTLLASTTVWNGSTHLD